MDIYVGILSASYLWEYLTPPYIIIPWEVKMQFIPQTLQYTRCFVCFYYGFSIKNYVWFQVISLSILVAVVYVTYTITIVSVT